MPMFACPEVAVGVGKDCCLSMYTEYFGFHGDPFADTAALTSFYINPNYQKAHATLLAGIQEHKGFLLLTGETGTGKTTLVRRLMRDVETSGHYVFFDSTSLASATIDDLLYFICAELGLHGGDNDRVAKLRMFSAYLRTLTNNGSTGVLLVDEAQHLNDEVLGGLRLIAPLDNKSEQLLLQIVLVGQPELEHRLAQPELRPIQQRVALRCRLTRLSDEEVAAYIFHRLQAVGSDRQDLFDREAMQHIVHASHGIPRLINIICDNALLLAYRTQSKTVSVRLIDEAVVNLHIGEPVTSPSLSPPEIRSPVAAEMLVTGQTTAAPVSALVAPHEERTVAPTSRWRWRYVTAGVLLALGAALVIQGRRLSLFSLRAPQALAITHVTPATEVGQPILLSEGQAQVFTLEVDSPRPEALQYVWLMDGKAQGTTKSWVYRPQFNEGGQRKTLTVRVTDLDQQMVEHSWNIDIQNVNRPPQIVNASPQAQDVRLAAGTTQQFTVSVIDPDASQSVEAVWFLDGGKVGQGQAWTFAPLPTTAVGDHSVTMTATDAEGATVEKRWTVTVQRNVPVPPLIIRTQPMLPVVIIAAGQGVTFAVEVANPHPDLRYAWFVDGQERAHGPRWTYQAQFTDGGQSKTISVQVRHPDMPTQTEEHRWTVDIQKVNRPPVITSAQPRTQEVKIQKGKDQRFTIAMADPDLGDRLTAVWLLDGKAMAQGQTWTFASPLDDAQSQHTVQVAVTDQDGMKVEKLWRVAITEPVRLPLQLIDVQPAAKELTVTVGQPIAFAAAVARTQVGVEYLWLLDGQEEGRGPRWIYSPQADDDTREKTVTVRVSHPEHKSVEHSWHLRRQATVPPPVSPSPPVREIVAPLLLQEPEVRAWIEAQRRALEERNVDTLVELGALSREQRERAQEILSQYKNFRVKFRNIAIHIEGNRAEVSFSRVDTIEEIEVVHPDRKRFVLQKEEGGRIRVQP